MHSWVNVIIKGLGKGLFFTLCFFWMLCQTSYAMTRSIGYPFEGRLENGIPFPREFRGYQLRSIDHTYTTPELIGALLDAIEGVRRDFPDTCDLYLGDFSKPGGGPWYPVHKSHQNGRDVDIGMYARGNVPLTNFVPMNEENLDLPKNWSLVLHLLNSHLVERIFVDSSIQRLLYNYALSQGYDKNFLDKVFQVGSGGYEYTFVRHEPNHRDHMHVRFVAPWSELAGRIEFPTPEQRRVIELAQSSFLPKKVLYYAKDEASPEVLSSKLGIPLEDLLRWNKLNRLDVVRPGTPIVFYKRGFDVESIQLAMSLDAMLMRSRTQGDLALLHNDVVLNIPPMMGRSFSSEAATGSNVQQNRPQQQQPTTIVQYRNPPSLAATASSHVTVAQHRNAPSAPPKFHVVRSGETLAVIAKKHDIPLKELLSLNKLTERSTLKPGQKLIVSSSQKSSLSLSNGKAAAPVALAIVAKASDKGKLQNNAQKNVASVKSPAKAGNIKASVQKNSNSVKTAASHKGSTLNSSTTSKKALASANSKSQKTSEPKSANSAASSGSKKVNLASASKSSQANVKNKKK